MPVAEAPTVSPVSMPVVFRRSSTTCTRVKAWGGDCTTRLLHHSVEVVERTCPYNWNGRRTRNRPAGMR